jgi:hypothetical protein
LMQVVSEPYLEKRWKLIHSCLHKLWIPASVQSQIIAHQEPLRRAQMAEMTNRPSRDQGAEPGCSSFFMQSSHGQSGVATSGDSEKAQENVYHPHRS